jgi:hypothetical protein
MMVEFCLMIHSLKNRTKALTKDINEPVHSLLMKGLKYTMSFLKEQALSLVQEATMKWIVLMS